LTEQLYLYFVLELIDFVELVKCVREGAFVKLMNNCKISTLLTKLCTQNSANHYHNNDPFKLLSENIESYLKEHNENATQFLLLIVGVLFLDIFVQMNWTGPLIEDLPLIVCVPFPLNENQRENVKRVD
jgi:hypothetical protein